MIRPIILPILFVITLSQSCKKQTQPPKAAVKKYDLAKIEGERTWHGTMTYRCWLCSTPEYYSKPFSDTFAWYYIDDSMIDGPARLPLLAADTIKGIFTFSAASDHGGGKELTFYYYKDSMVYKNVSNSFGAGTRIELQTK